jgi:dTMP kinase
VATAGRLVVFEGGEGSGKSTQVARLAAALASRGIAHRALREPGGTPLGAEIRQLLLHRDDEMEPRAEALLFMASRAELITREIGPALGRGEVVLLDRFFLSTYAYQIGGRSLPETEVREANRLATAGLVPDLTLLLVVSPEAGLARAARRSSALDRIESTGSTFHRRVADAFARFAEPEWQRAHPECGPIVSIDASGTEAEVGGRVARTLAARWPGTFPGVQASDQ